MTRPESPLQTIKQAELDLRQRVEEARHHAQAEVQAAQAEARQMVALADQQGQAEADACYRREIELSRREAGAIVATAQEEAAAMRRRAMTRLDDVAKYIIELAVPSGVISG